MPRISFLSSNCHHEHPEEKHIFMEIEFEGYHWRIDIGKYGGNERPSIHIAGPIWLEIDHHSVDALDVYCSAPNGARREEDDQERKS